MTIPELRTHSLTIVPFSISHLSERYVGWLNATQLMRFSEQRHKVHDMTSCKAFHDSFGDSDNGFWAIEEYILGLDHIGNITANIDRANRLADVGFLIGEKPARGKGYGCEAFRAVVQYLLMVGGMRKVAVGDMSANTAMLSIVRRSGLIDDGVGARPLLFEDGQMDVVHMAAFAQG